MTMTEDTGSAKRIEDGDPLRWSNGITVKRTQYGYTWSIAVAAASHSMADMQDAIDRAAEIDEQLRVRFPSMPSRRGGRDY